jgi:hypothetical protein
MLGAMLVGRAQQPADSRPAGFSLQETASPAAPNSAEPQLTTKGGQPILSWLELNGRHATLRFSAWTASGWASARTAAEGDDFMINSADVPSVSRIGERLVAEWLQQDGPDPEAYKLRLSWSTDDGRSWSPAMSPHHDKVQTQHGFGTLFQTRGGFGVAWLDGRAIPEDAAEGVGNMALRAALFDASGKQLGDAVVDSRVCECCPLASAATADGPIVAYRNRTASEVRDIYVTRLTNSRWTAPVAVHRDNWVIEGCPVNGPAISARDRDVAVAWFSGKGGTGHSFVGFSRDSGRTFSAPIRVDETSSGGRVSIALLDDGSAVVGWVEASEPSAFMARRIDPRGAVGPAVRVGESGGTRYPRLTRAGNDVLFAWTETVGDTPTVKTALAKE